MKRSMWIGAVLLGTCAALAAAPSAKKNDADTAIRKINHWTAEHFTAKDVDQMIDGYFAPEAMWLPNAQEAVVGREAIRAKFRELLNAVSVDKFTIEVVKIEQSGDMAYEIGRETFAFTGKDGVKKESHGKYLAVWKRQANGEWRCMADAPSSETRQ